MLAPQAIVIMALASWGASLQAALILALGLGQVWAMRVMMQDPKARAPWYNGTGVMMYIVGMMIAATALRGLA